MQTLTTRALVPLSTHAREIHVRLFSVNQGEKNGVAAEVLQTIAMDPKHLGLGDDEPPACAWHRARRWALCGRQDLGGLPVRVHSRLFRLR